MWYIYMLVGLYLLMPFMSAWIAKGDRTMTRTYVILWGCSLLLPYLRYAVAPYIFGECAWNEFNVPAWDYSLPAAGPPAQERQRALDTQGRTARPAALHRDMP